MTNALLSLAHFGQSLWISDLSRDMLMSRRLRRLRDDFHVRGTRLDAAAIETAIRTSGDYDCWLADVDGRTDPAEVSRRILMRLVRGAADVLAPVYARSRRRDGLALLDLSPWLAHDPGGLEREALQLWNRVGRENVVLLLPATAAGLRVLPALIARGVNAGVTGVLSPHSYESCWTAYREGLAALAGRGGHLDRITGTAIFPVGRLDTALDRELIQRLRATRDEEEGADLARLLGRPAMALAQETWRRFRNLCDGPEWTELAMRGAHPLRLCWDGAGARGLMDRPLTFIEELIGPETSHLAREEALDILGMARIRPTLHRAEPAPILAALDRLEVPWTGAVETLLDRIVDEATTTFDRLTEAVERRHRRITPMAPSKRLRPAQRPYAAEIIEPPAAAAALPA